MSKGTCQDCGGSFEYSLVHNGFNDSAYAYCDRCGATAILSGWSEKSPEDVKFRVHGLVEPEVVDSLLPCTCGGRYTVGATPRCPCCNTALSAEDSTEWIEGNARGTAQGWRWQRAWDGMYCIVVEGKVAEDPWQERTNT